jgi:UDP-N-acetylglucosamine acyltransferase
VDPCAQLDSSAQIGPGVVIGPQVRIGPETTVGAYTVIEGDTTIGARNRIFQFASLGSAPQDLKYHGEPSRLEIGDDNKIREFATVHRGTEGGGMVTRIGNGVLVMNYVHVAHDCIVGDHCIVANSTQLGGHCVLEDWVVAAALCGLHQFTRIGRHAMLAAGSRVAQDVPPFAMVQGDRARLVGVNTVGLERRSFDAATTAAIKRAYRTLFFSKLLRDQAIAKVLERDGEVAEVRGIIEFLQRSERGVVGRSRD